MTLARFERKHHLLIALLLAVAIGLGLAVGFGLWPSGGSSSGRHPGLTRKARAEHWLLNRWLPLHYGYYPVKQPSSAVCVPFGRRFWCRLQHGRSVWELWLP